MKYFFPVLLFSLCFNLTAQELEFDNSNLFYQIYPVYNFKQSIVSLTFDDGTRNQFKVAIPILKEMNIPATFYLIISYIDSTTKGTLLRDTTNDIEFGSHTATHPNLNQIGSDKAKMELLNSRSFLKKYLGKKAGLTMSYPWGMYNSTIKEIAKKNYLAARTTDPGYNSLNDLDLYALKAKAFGKETELQSANGWVNYAIQNHLWLVEMLHGINKIGFSPIDSSELIKHLSYIKTVEADIWCAKMSDVAKYITESKSAKITCEYCTDSVFNIRINDYLNDTIFNHQLSVRIKVPAFWDSIYISNGEKVRTESSNNSKFVLFNALPDNQILTIRPKLISAPERNSGMRFVYLSPNPFFDEIKFSLEFFEQTDLDIKLINMNGQLLINQTEKSVNGVVNMYFDTSGISKGIYFLSVISSRGDRIIKKLIKS